jgi:hypothetical protein
MMKKLFLLSKDEREGIFQVAAESSTIPLEIIEKDYWVVWNNVEVLACAVNLKRKRSGIQLSNQTSNTKLPQI